MNKETLKAQLMAAFAEYSKRDDVTADELAGKWSDIIDTYVKAMLTAWIAKAVPIPQDGGAGIKTTLTAALTTL